MARGEIEQALAPYVVRRMRDDDAEVLSMLARLRSEWRRRYLASFLRRAVAGSLKRVGRVRGAYTQVWSLEQYPGSREVEEGRSYLRWGSEVIEVRGWAEKRVHLLIVSRVLAALRPRRLLEIGSGNGAMLMMLSTLCPEVECHGVELTEAGVARARQIQQLDRLPAAMERFPSQPPPDPLAFKRVRFEVGNAAKLPFDDGSFDIVLTSLALEQMNSVRAQVLAQLARVSSGHVLMLEPFPDFNREPERRDYTRANEYFSVPVGALPRHGLEPLVIFNDFPSKLLRGVGLVLARPVKAL